MRLGLGLGLGAHRKVGGEPYSDVLALEYAIPAAETTIELAIKADSNWFDAGQEASIDWGDSSAATVVSATSGQSGYIAHEYADAGTYMVKVSGTMKAYRRAGEENLAGQDLLTHIRSFGKLGIESFRHAFYRCTGLISVPKYLPKSISDMSSMFYSCSGAAFNPDVSNWDVSNVENMQLMFRNCSGAAFNPDVSAWDVSNVGSMSNMFYSCSGAAFNPDVSNWDVSNVENMSYMFCACPGNAFNPDVSNWDVSNVKNMSYMFYRCSGDAFNPDVSNWDVSNVKNMSYMFYRCSGDAFNPDVSNWDVSNVGSMSNMFYRCPGNAFRGGRGTAGTGIANWTPDSLTSAENFMPLSKKQEDGFLDPILTAWAALIDDTEHPLPEDITIHFGDNTYTTAASAAISALENHGWVISSGGLAV